jgi:nucleoside-diphosphate-sugar epimerase
VIAPLEAYRDVPVLILGATGFIGRWMARWLTSARADLHLAVRDAGRAGPRLARWEASGRIHVVDLACGPRACALVAAVAPAITFNLAAHGVDPAGRDAGQAERLNSALPAALAEAVGTRPVQGWQGCTLVHAGSALEYGAAGGDLAEDGPCRPTTLYGRTKLAGTLGLAAACARAGVRGVAARLFAVYGPGERAGRLLPALAGAAGGRRALDLTTGTQRRDFTYVEDAVEGLLRLGVSSARPGEIVNLATGTLTSVRDFALTAAGALGLPHGWLRFGALPARDGEMAHEPVRIARLRTLLGWSPPAGVEEGIRRALASRLPLADDG